MDRTTKSKTFKASIHGETLMFLIIPIIVAAALFLLGKSYSPAFPKEADPLMRTLFVITPQVFGGIILFIAIATLIANLTTKITVTPVGLHYKRGGKEFECKWRVLSFAPPKPNQKFLKTFTISDGTILARVNSVFFPKFDTMVKFIKKAKGIAVKGGYDL